MASNFDTIHLKLSTDSYFALLFHPMLSEYENSKKKFYDVITSVLYSHLSWNNSSTGSVVNIAKFKNYVDSFCHRSYFAMSTSATLVPKAEQYALALSLPLDAEKARNSWGKYIKWKYER